MKNNLKNNLALQEEGDENVEEGFPRAHRFGLLFTDHQSLQPDTHTHTQYTDILNHEQYQHERLIADEMRLVVDAKHIETNL